MKNRIPQTQVKYTAMSIFAAVMLQASCYASTFDIGRDNNKQVMVNGYTMSYVEQGEGEPLILIHGALSDYRSWKKLQNELAEDNRTIAVSLRHYYPEIWDGKGNDLSIDQHVEDMAEFIRKLGAGPVNIVGHSRGGAVAMLLASSYPELVKNLVLADPAPLYTMLIDKPAAIKSMDTRKLALQKSMANYQKGDTDGGLKEFVEYIAGKNAWQKTDQKRRDAMRQNAQTLTSLLEDAKTSFTCEQLRQVTSPVLLITGQHSKSIYHQMNESVESCLNNITKVVIADAGHMMYEANPTAFIFEVQDFIAQ